MPSSDIMEFERRQMKQCRIRYYKKKSLKNPPLEIINTSSDNLGTHLFLPFLSVDRPSDSSFLDSANIISNVCGEFLEFSCSAKVA
jgi:hypothetical protein